MKKKPVYRRKMSKKSFEKSETFAGIFYFFLKKICFFNDNKTSCQPWEIGLNLLRRLRHHKTLPGRGEVQ